VAASGVIRVGHLLSGDLWAGAEVATFHLIRALHARPDVEVRAVLLNPGELARRLSAGSVPVRIEPERGRSFVSLARAVRRQLADVDLVHAHRYKEDLLATLSGRPWVATQHGLPEPFHGLAALRMAVYGRLDRLAQRASARTVVAVSREVEAHVAAVVGRARAVRVWNGIQDPWDRVRPEPWLRRPRRVGVVARLFPVKAVALAIQAAAACAGLELEIVGEGPERQALERQIAAARAAERIRLVGFEADPLPRLAGWRALLVPSLREGNPVSVLEALALGTPVLAADLPGVAEILDGRGGWIEPDRDPAAWARRLAEVTRDECAGAATSAAARARFLESFTDLRCAGAICAVYRAALAA
jgi:glycosyltransferase involved in cell wall biosynthesis